MRMRLMVLLMILLAAGCTDEGRRSSPAAPAAPSPSPSPSPDAVDTATQACREVKKIVDKGYRVTTDQLYELGELGRTSADREISQKANLLSVSASLAGVQIQAGGDKAQVAEDLRGAVDELLEACRAGNY